MFGLKVNNIVMMNNGAWTPRSYIRVSGVNFR